MEVNSNGKITDGVNHCYAFGKVNDKNLLIDNDFPCPAFSNHYGNFSHDGCLPYLGGGTSNGTVRILNFEWLVGVPRTITTTTTITETTTITTTFTQTTTKTTSTTATSTTTITTTTHTVMTTATTTTADFIPEIVITIPYEKDKIDKHNGKFLRYLNDI